MSSDRTTDPALAEEEQRIRQLRLLVAMTTAVLRTRPLTYREAEQVIEESRQRVLALFPDKGAVFDLIYRPRFHRIIRERLGAEG
jgi:hypothetical protein